MPKNNKNFQPSVSKALQQIRREKRISQIELAQILEASTSSISLWESGKRFPSNVMREKICKYFDVDMNFLTGYSPIHRSIYEEDNVVSVGLYSGIHLRKDIDETKLRLKNNIFDVDYTISNMKLPKKMFRDTASYFALECRQKGLEMNGINYSDIGIFVYANADDIEDNEIVCAYLKDRAEFRIFNKEDSNYYTLSKAYNDDSPMTVKYAKNEIIIGKLVYKISRPY